MIMLEDLAAMNRAQRESEELPPRLSLSDQAGESFLIHSFDFDREYLVLERKDDAKLFWTRINRVLRKELKRALDRLSLTTLSGLEMKVYVKRGPKGNQYVALESTK